MERALSWTVFAGIGLLTVAAMMVPPAEGFKDPELARIIFFHLPSAYTTAVFAVWAASCSAVFLVRRSWVWELRAVAASEMALTMGVATMLTGILFSRTQWGAWWHWDARQTSFLIVLFLLGAYFAVRMAFDEEQGRARASAAYSVMTLLPILFLFAVFPKLPQVASRSLHPQGVVAEMRFSSDYRAVVLSVFALLLIVTFSLYRMHVRANLVANELRNLDGNLEDDRGDSADNRVVMPVPVQPTN